MQINPLQTFATATRVYIQGEPADAPDALALAWIKAGYAEPIAVEDSFAAVAAPEAAVRRRGRPRKAEQ